MPDFPLYDEVIMISASSRLAEDDTDAAILSTTRMIERIIAGQQGMNAPRHMAQPALRALGSAIADHVNARQSILRAEAELVSIAAKYGATPTSYGDSWPCPPEPKGALSDVPALPEMA